MRAVARRRSPHPGQARSRRLLRAGDFQSNSCLARRCGDVCCRSLPCSRRGAHEGREPLLSPWHRAEFAQPSCPASRQACIRADSALHKIIARSVPIKMPPSPTDKRSPAKIEVSLRQLLRLLALQPSICVAPAAGCIFDNPHCWNCVPRETAHAVGISHVWRASLLAKLSASMGRRHTSRFDINPRPQPLSPRYGAA